MSEEPSTTYFKYKNLEDLLKVILFAAQSPIGMIPMFYHIKYKDTDLFFIETGAINPVIHFIIVKEKPEKKFIELKHLTGKYEFVDHIGSDTQSIYIPILELENVTFEFPL
ncbi:MAG: hypothetical protein DA328_06325 [Nitrososphaeraceae archaeon]|nr:hypothetical protein [Nitrososphaeraceae archaeon]